MFVIQTKKIINTYVVCIVIMEDKLEGVLIENIRSFMKSARLVYASRDYTSAAIIYFKALFSVFDLAILREKGFVPKDHTERFRLLREEFLDLYAWIDRYFEIYRNSYNAKIEKEDCDTVKEYVEELIKKQKIL